jgi:hypothetical protein
VNTTKVKIREEKQRVRERERKEREWENVGLRVIRVLCTVIKLFYGVAVC